MQRSIRIDAAKDLGYRFEQVFARLSVNSFSIAQCLTYVPQQRLRCAGKTA